MRLRNFTFISLLLISISTNIFAQEEIGKIFSVNEADSLYGKVIESYTMHSDSLLRLISKTKDKVMFQLKNNNVVITGNKRNVLFSNGIKISDEDELRVLSKSKVLELIALGRSEKVIIQKRNITLTIENGKYVLEFTFPCPPYCD